MQFDTETAQQVIGAPDDPSPPLPPLALPPLPFTALLQNPTSGLPSSDSAATAVGQAFESTSCRRASPEASAKLPSALQQLARSWGLLLLALFPCSMPSSCFKVSVSSSSGSRGGWQLRRVASREGTWSL